MQRTASILAALAAAGVAATVYGGVPSVLPVTLAVVLLAALPFAAASAATTVPALVALWVLTAVDGAPRTAPLLAAVVSLTWLTPQRRIVVPFAATLAGAWIVFAPTPVAMVAAVLAAAVAVAAWSSLQYRSTALTAAGFIAAMVLVTTVPLIAFVNGATTAGALATGAALAALVALLAALRAPSMTPRLLACAAAAVLTALPVALTDVSTDRDESGLPPGAVAMGDCIEYGNDTIKAVECYAVALIDYYRGNGLPETITLVKEAFAAPGRVGMHFAENCHESMHFLGKAVALDYRDNLPEAIRLGTDMCSAGFGHGIWEMQYGILPTSDLVEKVPSICRGWEGAQRDSDAAGIGCRHILGHTLATRYRGKVDEIAPVCLVRDPAVDPELEWSEPEIQARNNCLAGLFMENNLDLNRFRSTDVDDRNPFFVCEQPSVASNEIIAWGCYNEVGAMLVAHFDFDLPASLQACKSQQAKFDLAFWIIESCYDSVSRAISPAFEYDPAALESACLEVPAGELRDYCVKGIAASVTFSSNDPTAGIRLCEVGLPPSKALDACLARVAEIEESLGKSRSLGDGKTPLPVDTGTAPGI